MAEVTVVIPNYNGIGYLKDCLDTLREQTCKNYETVLVDNGSTDGSLAFVKEHYPWVKILALDRNYGFCHAVNAGIRAAESSYVFLLNNDTKLHEDCIEELLIMMRQHPHCFSCSARMIKMHEPDKLDDAGDYYCALGWAYALGKDRPWKDYLKPRKVFAACGGASMYRRSVFEKIGRFDEAHFAYLEDIDVSEKKQEVGFYMPVQRVCRPDHTFRGFQGQIESGSISVGDEIITLPSNEHAKVKSILVGDKNADSADAGRPVTIQLDKEVDVSRGCVLTTVELPVSKKFTATILWMDDQELTVGKDYLVKIGTETIPGILKNIQYKIDVNTGEYIPVGRLRKNEIAVCDLVLQEEIVLDAFLNHKTLGELILIDRITNMTSACGVVENPKLDESKDVKCAFVSGNLKANGDIFEEFYYDLESMTVFKVQPSGKTYTIGDEIPVVGESYRYPDSFDVVVLRDQVAVQVRDRKITVIQPLADYTYNDVPVINGRGFAVHVSSQTDLDVFKAELASEGSSISETFFNKWVDFETYRKIVFKDQHWN